MVSVPEVDSCSFSTTALPAPRKSGESVLENVIIIPVIAYDYKQRGEHFESIGLFPHALLIIANCVENA